MLGNRLTGPIEPGHVESQFQQRTGRKVFRGIRLRIAQRFEQPLFNQNRDIMRHETKESRRPRHVEARVHRLGWKFFVHSLRIVIVFEMSRCRGAVYSEDSFRLCWSAVIVRLAYFAFSFRLKSVIFPLCGDLD